MSSISILLVASTESFRVRRCVRDLERARAVAEAEGFRAVVSVLPFRASPDMHAWLGDFVPAEWQVLSAEEDDLPTALAAWAEGSACERLGVLGPVESISSRWLAECAARPASRWQVWHPEAMITYGPNFFDRGEMSLLRLPQRLDRNAASATSVPLPASFVASRELLVSCPCPRQDPGRGWGEAGWTDMMRWWWVNRLLVAGAEFEAVPGCFQYRAMADGEGLDTLLTPAAAHLLGPYLRLAPEPAAAARFGGWTVPERPGPSQMISRRQAGRDIAEVRDYLKQVEEARDWFRQQAERWEAEAKRLAGQ